MLIDEARLLKCSMYVVLFLADNDGECDGEQEDGWRWLVIVIVVADY